MSQAERLAEADEEEVLDYIIHLPELDAALASAASSASGAPPRVDFCRLGEVSLAGLDTATPTLRLGAVTFVGQHQHFLGCAAVFSLACAHGRGGGAAAAGAAATAPACCTAAAAGGAGATDALAFAAVTRRRIVFTRVDGDLDALLRGALEQDAAAAAPAAAPAAGSKRKWQRGRGRGRGRGRASASDDDDGNDAGGGSGGGGGGGGDDED